MDLGFIQEGYDIVWANDFEHWACETYKKNFGPHIVEGDIADINFKNIPKCDLITGGFPCQDFSMIWKRGGLETDRGNLYKYFVKAVATKLPKAFVAENVKGLLTANKGMAIRQIVKDFQKVDHLGYRIYINLFNFAEYGVPQIRERVIIVGIRSDIPYEFKKPKPTHYEGNYATAGEALKGVEKVPYNNEHMQIHDRTIKIISLIPPGGNFTDIPQDSPYYVKGMISHVYRRIHPNKPSKTIIAGGGGGTWGYHHIEPRPLTNRERARLFGFPDDFIFEGNISQVRKQIGNAVPPPGARVVAKELRKLFAGDFEKADLKSLKPLSGDVLNYVSFEETNQLNFI
ncbi:DNA (cytosine-5-)-methyltransferase [Candidatus Woesebacteria bacterium RIFCSPHIGHO2_12_FULL_44_11]|uniref:Cytosine-specific methyltransferase n=1 Tax=Candidatus Woesebacteria bacterium RIFCSPLOWO2_01_FULL_44_14 TaxID=1802525 RepID=A0A1F8C3W5_9BACT|nr:MAG: DNA (cytosine-5-)-methyltransferase [Candidatus Woesebacteria bacterium RIFCSPHIGHO2_12_FULL_44_11]OGM70972.1 MAG: DNA (cytosine-5-)-methyltransferase [Candidatus Woesebacteria bacterium RIFCSPLOWO2_01_FULL_44_14]